MKANRFTLLDLVAVGALCLLGAGLLTPAVAHARARARAASCANNLKMMALALHNYHDALGTFPPGRVWQADLKRNELDPGTATMLLPFAEQTRVYNSYNFNLAWNGPQNRTARNVKIELYLCPEEQKQSVTENNDPTGQPTNYAFNLGAEAWHTSVQPGTSGGGPAPEGLFYDNSRIGLRDIIDGTSNTVMISEQLIDRPRRSGVPGEDGECSGNAVDEKQFSDRTGSRWVTGHPSSGFYNARRTPNHSDPDCFGLVTPRGIGTLNKVARSNHPMGVHVGMADGRVQFAANSIDPTVWRQLHTRAGQERVDTDSVLGPPIATPAKPGPANNDRGAAGPPPLVMRRTTDPETVNDKEGRWQFWGGDLLGEDMVVGHFSVAIRFSTANPLNAGSARTTLFLKGDDPPENVVLEGSYSSSSGSQTGSVSAASERLRHLIGSSYRVKDNMLTIAGTEPTATARPRPQSERKP